MLVEVTNAEKVKEPMPVPLPVYKKFNRVPQLKPIELPLPVITSPPPQEVITTAEIITIIIMILLIPIGV